MNKARKNVVIVGFTEQEKSSISVPLIDEPYCYSRKVHYINSLKEISKYQGYLLLIDNSINIDIIELDKKYRATFNKFENVWIYNEKYDDYFFSKWSKIEKVGREIFNYDSFGLGENWEEYKNNKEHGEKEIIKYNKDKQEKLNILYNYIRKYKTRKTSEIAKSLNLNERTIQRYMHDLNEKHHNIGYDYSLNEWYFSKR